LLEKYTQAIGQPFELPDELSVAAYQKALAEARSARLLRERLWRSFLALVLAVLPLYWLVRRDKKMVWLAAGALIYTLAFHVLYAVVGGKTYSLSWVSSPEELLGFLVGISILSLAVAWVAVLLGLKLYRLAPSRAAGLVVGFVALTIYFLALPVLFSFSLNGAVVTWTLPHYRSAFLAFLSLMQIAYVAILGLVLAGFTAIVSWSVGRVFNISRI